MNTAINIIINAIFQIILFSFLPFLAWLAYRKKKTNVGFFEYVGLIRPERRAKWWILFIVLALYLCIYNFVDPSMVLDNAAEQMLQNNPSITGNQYVGLGMATIFPAFVTSFIQNGLCEEMLFRGFLCKRLIQRVGCPVGIVLQAAIFALMHNLMYITILPNIGFHILMFLFISTQAAILAVINEKLFNGSIWPSVLLHGGGNFFAIMLTAF